MNGAGYHTQVGGDFSRKIFSGRCIMEYGSGQEGVMNLFGGLLKEARTRAGLTQKELAERVGITDSYISKMETGVFPPPSREVAVKLADAVGISDKAERFSFLLTAGVVSEEDVKGLPSLGTPSQSAASASTVFHTPLATSHQKILMHRLAVLEKKLEAVEKNLYEAHAAAAKNLQEIHEELRELAAFVEEMFNQE
jgi:transcriptional regulator with XRE-family HTH domain